MRLWSIHPKYLDSIGLIALWREGLLAQKVLKGETKGYRNHPQLLRFRAHPHPVRAIGYYLDIVIQEGKRRGYSFNFSKIDFSERVQTIPINKGQIIYEFQLLKQKLFKRKFEKYMLLEHNQVIEPHPLFYLQEGPIESWERI